MALTSDAASLLFRARGDTDDARKAFRELKADIKDTSDAAGKDGVSGLEKFGQSIGLSESKAASLATALPIVGAAAVAMGAAIVAGAVTGAKALFDLARGASDFGSEIYDASQKTGLGAEALSALKFAAEQSGSSFEQVTKGITVFGATIGDAANGSEKAQGKLKALGVTSQELDTALEQVFKTIAEGKNDTDRLALASAAFGKKIGPDLIPLIKDANGNFGELIQKAKDLGVTIGDKAAAQADAFGDTMDLLNAQLDGVARTIGFSVMPIFLEWATKLSNFLTRNQNEIARWSNAFAKAMEFIAASIVNNIDAFAGLAQILTAIFNQDWNLAAAGVERITKAIQAQRSAWGDLNRPTRGNVQEAGGKVRELTPLPNDDEEASKKRAEERQKLAERDAAAQIRILEAQLRDALKAYDDYQKKLLDKFAETKDSDALKGGFGIAEALLKTELDQIIPALEAAENAQAASQKKTNNELILLKKEQDDRIAEINKKKEEAAADANKKLTEAEKKAAKESVDTAKQATEEVIAIYKAKTETLIAEFERLKAKGLISEKQYADAVGRLKLQQLEQERALTEDAGRRQILDEEIKQQKIQTSIELIEQTNKESEAYDKYRESVWNAQMAQAELNARQREMLEQASPFQQALVSVAEMMTNAFQGIANAIGNVVQQWVLYGKTGPAVMRQILAQALASIAAEAAVRAIFELAKGFAALFLNPAEAASHFTAAALFGSIAVGAGLAGRAVAGNSFNQQSSGAYGGASSGSEAVNAQSQPLVFTERFNGFQAQMIEIAERQNVILGKLDGTIENSIGRLEGVSGADMVRIGAKDAPEAIREAFEAELGSDLRASTNFFRQTGQYR